MQYKHSKKTELGNAVIHGESREEMFLLPPADIFPEFLPGDVLWLFEENVLQILQIRMDMI